MTHSTKALIVGGSIGLATAKTLLQLGIATTIVGSSAEKLTSAQKQLQGVGELETLQANLYEPNDVQRLIDFINNNDHHIKYLVNAAGKFKPTSFLDHHHSDYDAYMDLNRAAFFLSQSVARNMVEHGGGSIVHIGSMWAKQAIKATPSSAYSMAKAGLHSLNTWRWNWRKTTYELMRFHRL